LILFCFSCTLVNCRKEVVSNPNPNSIDGPIVSMSDADFFASINLEYQGLEKVKAAVDIKDYHKAIIAYAKFQRERQKPIHHYPKKLPSNYPSSQRLAVDHSAELILENT